MLRYAHLYGTREAKYAALSVGGMEWNEIEAAAPFYLFKPQDADLRDEYEQGIRLPEAMPVNVLGFQSHRDGFAIGFGKAEVLNRFASLRAST